MKYRFHPSGKRSRSLISKGTRLRLAGRDKLKKIKPLPLPIEQIELSDGAPQKRGSLFAAKLKRWAKRLYATTKKIVLNIYKGIYRVLVCFGRGVILAAKGAVKLSRKALTRLIAFAVKQRKNAPSLATLAGAATASALVCAISGLYVIFGLFSFYARSYETVTVPRFTGISPNEAVYDENRFNLIIQYESNPDVADGVVITQSPPAGVTRRIYGRDGYCDVLLTVSRSEKVNIPSDLVGMTLRDASLLLHNNALSVRVVEEYSRAEETGKIISVYPKGGSEAKDGDVVTLTVGLGEKINEVFAPQLTGLSESDAINRLRAAGLSLGEITYRTSTEETGTVIAQSIPKGTSTPTGAAISLTVSAGEEFNAKTVPDLYGLSVEEAERRLRQVGLTVGGIYSVSSAAKNNTVISQSPSAGTPISSSLTSVDLGVSKNKQT